MIEIIHMVSFQVFEMYLVVIHILFISEIDQFNSIHKCFLRGNNRFISHFTVRQRKRDGDFSNHSQGQLKYSYFKTTYNLSFSNGESKGLIPFFGTVQRFRKISGKECFVMHQHCRMRRWKVSIITRPQNLYQNSCSVYIEMRWRFFERISLLGHLSSFSFSLV